MRVVIGFPMLSSIIEFEPFLGEDIKLYQEKFDEWYSKNFTPYKGLRNKKGDYDEIFDANVVINWIKEVAPEANPMMIVEEMNPDDVDPSLPGMYF